MNNADRIELPAAKPNAHIGILGGSFDPPHLGHALLGLSFLSLEPIDELWIIPCANHAEKGSLSDFNHRFAMCHIAFNKIKQVRVLDLENRLKAPNYTIETINCILRLRPDLALFLALGSDLIGSFEQWHQAADIVQQTAIVIFERTNFPITKVPDILSKSHVHEGYSLPDTNSTSLRTYLSEQKKGGIKPLLDRDVFDYIKHHQLYR